MLRGQRVSDLQTKLLREGRGAGFRAALDAGRTACADVLDCVLNDPRWDRQVEARDDYYARLLLGADSDIDVLGRYVVEVNDEADEADLWLPIGVLAELSRHGANSARLAMSEAVRTGERWRACLGALEAAGGADLIDQVVNADIEQALVTRVGVEQVAEAVAVVAAPWERWAEQIPALRFVVNSAGTGETRSISGPVAWAASRIRYPKLPGNLGALSSEFVLAQASIPGAATKLSDELARRTDANTRRLLSAAAGSGTVDERHVALRALGKHGSTEFVGAAEEFLRQESTLAPTERHEHRLRQGFLRYLEELLPSHTLPLARAWLFEPWPLSLAAEHILARHATADDRQLLERAGVAALENGDMYRLCSTVDAINAAGPEVSLPFLTQVYEHAPYSYARRRVVNAMSRCRIGEATKPYLTEALWDCEPESRELACRAIGKSKDFTRARIEQIARDDFEDTAVRDAARGALDVP